MSNTKKDGLQRLLDFLDFLKTERIEFSIHNRSHDSMSVDFAALGIRYEVDFFPDCMTFSYFKGNEDVFQDDKMLDNLMQDSWNFKTKRLPSNT
jgi:hypothetical protein